MHANLTTILIGIFLCFIIGIINIASYNNINSCGNNNTCTIINNNNECTSGNGHCSCCTSNKANSPTKSFKMGRWGRQSPVLEPEPPPPVSPPPLPPRHNNTFMRQSSFTKIGNMLNTAISMNGAKKPLMGEFLMRLLLQFLFYLYSSYLYNIYLFVC